MAELGVRFADPENVKETLATGPCIVAQQGDLVEIIFTIPRHRPEVLAAEEPEREPVLVLVGRFVMHSEGALALADLINRTVGAHKAKAGHVLRDDQGGHA